MDSRLAAHRHRRHAMILALVTPYYFPSVRGNSITVQRIESGLRDQGLTVQVFSLDQHSSEAILAGGKGT